MIGIGLIKKFFIWKGDKFMMAYLMLPLTILSGFIGLGIIF
jgi:hypothetical protein